jgi:sugar phosphate isomerase/epimerase
MSAAPLHDLSRLCIHTITHKPWTIEEAAAKFSASGVGGITVWRDTLTGRDIRKTGNLLRQLRLEIVSLCRGGFFPAVGEDALSAAVAENIKAIDEASELGAPMLVLVCGALPGQALEKSRSQIRQGIEACVKHAEQRGVKLTIEPLHPMYAGDRSAVNTLRQANDMAEYFASPWVGIAVDVYHLWWDPELEDQVRRCAENGNLSAFHICDWKLPTVDMLNDRGLMGEGCIDVKKIRGWVEATGFNGFNEVEIFSTRYWQQDQDKFFGQVKTAYLQNS